MERWRPASRLTLIPTLARLILSCLTLACLTLACLTLACLTLACLTGCSRQAVPVSAGSGGSGQLPFDRASDGNGVSPTEAFAFEGLPAGTEITIRLRSALSSANSHVGDSFEALLDDSVVIGGKTVAPRGAPVTGSVVDTKSFAGHDPGYLRMTLASIALNGKSVPLQTSSIFAKGGSYGKRAVATANSSQAGMPEALTGYERGVRIASAAGPGDVRFSTGHRFTFRLIQPLHL